MSQRCAKHADMRMNHSGGSWYIKKGSKKSDSAWMWWLCYQEPENCIFQLKDELSCVRIRPIPKPHCELNHAGEVWETRWYSRHWLCRKLQCQNGSKKQCRVTVAILSKIHIIAPPHWEGGEVSKMTVINPHGEVNHAPEVWETFGYENKTLRVKLSCQKWLHKLKVAKCGRSLTQRA